jgi:hypothetical protein
MNMQIPVFGSRDLRDLALSNQPSRALFPCGTATLFIGSRESTPHLNRTNSSVGTRRNLNHEKQTPPRQRCVNSTRLKISSSSRAQPVAFNSSRAHKPTSREHKTPSSRTPCRPVFCQTFGAIIPQSAIGIPQSIPPR